MSSGKNESIQSSATEESLGEPAVSIDYAQATTEPKLRTKAMRGSAWMMGGFGLTKMIAFFSNVIITKLIMPELFGIMTLVQAFLIALRMFSDVGIGPSIVRSELGDQDRFLRTAWTMQFVRGMGMWFVSLVIAYPAALLFKVPQLAYLIPICGLNALIEGIRSTAYYRLARRLRLREQATLEVARQFFIATLMIAWAYVSPTIWALVVPVLVVTLCESIFTHFLMRDRRDRFGWDRECARMLTRFGTWIFISTVLTFFANQLDRLIFGGLLDLKTLGVYGVAWLLASTPTLAILKVGASVVFPTYSIVQNEPKRFKWIFPRMRMMLLALGGFACAGLIACGPSLVQLLYHGPYEEAGWMVQLLAISSWFQILEVTNGSALLARGKSRWIAASTFAKVVVMSALLPLGFYFANKDGSNVLYGLAGALIGIGISDAARYLVSTIGSTRLKLGVSLFGTDILLTLFVAITGVGTMFLLRWINFGPMYAFPLSALIISVCWLPLCYVCFKRTRGTNQI